jgi:hypothetical protein
MNARYQSPAVLNIHQLVYRLTGEWGYAMLKLDFDRRMRQALQSKLTRAESIRLGLEVIARGREETSARLRLPIWTRYRRCGCHAHRSDTARAGSRTSTGCRGQVN